MIAKYGSHHRINCFPPEVGPELGFHTTCLAHRGDPNHPILTVDGVRTDVTKEGHGLDTSDQLISISGLPWICILQVVVILCFEL